MVTRSARPLIVLAVFWAALYLPHLLRGQTLPARDVAATQIPWRVVWQQQVREGRIPIWDPYSNHGRPLAANPNTMAFYPGTVLFLVLEPESAAAWHLALHHLLLLVGCYWLARRSCGDVGAAGVAAAAVGTTGVAFSLLTFVNAQATFAWAPWALATALHPPATGTARARRALAGGALLGLAALGGEPVAALLTAFAWVVVVVFLWRPAPLVACAVATGGALLVAAPVLVPLLTLVGETARGAIGPSAAAVGADTLALRRLPELLAPNLLGPPLAEAGGGFWARASFPWQRYYPLIFPGSLLFLLVPLAGRRRELRPWWVLLTTGVLGAALLSWNPAAVLLRHLVAGAGLRYGIKLLLLAVLATVPLAAAGWLRLRASWREGGRRPVIATAALAAALALPATAPDQVLRPALGSLYPASRPALQGVDTRDLSFWLFGDAAALAAAPLVIAVAGPTAPAAMAAALAANVVAGRGVLLFDEDARWAQRPHVAAELPEGARIAATEAMGAPTDGPADPALARFWAFRSALAPNYATRWRIGYALTRGPDGLEPVRQELLAAAADQLAPDARRRLAAAVGATAWVVDAPANDATPGVRTVPLQGAPEAYLATRLIECDGVAAAVTALADPAFRPGGDAVVEGSGGARRLAGGTVTELAGRPDHRVFDVAAEGAGLLVVQQSFLSSWRATVDRAATPVRPANFAFVGVPVPAGRHRVEIRVDPRPYWYGLCGPLLAAGIAVILRRRRGAVARD